MMVLLNGCYSGNSLTKVFGDDYCKINPPAERIPIGGKWNSLLGTWDDNTLSADKVDTIGSITYVYNIKIEHAFLDLGIKVLSKINTKLAGSIGDNDEIIIKEAQIVRPKNISKIKFSKNEKYVFEGVKVKSLEIKTTKERSMLFENELLFRDSNNMNININFNKDKNILLLSGINLFITQKIVQTLEFISDTIFVDVNKNKFMRGYSFMTEITDNGKISAIKIRSKYYDTTIVSSEFNTYFRTSNRLENDEILFDEIIVETNNFGAFEGKISIIQNKLPFRSFCSNDDDQNITSQNRIYFGVNVIEPNKLFKEDLTYSNSMLSSVVKLDENYGYSGSLKLRTFDRVYMLISFQYYQNTANTIVSFNNTSRNAPLKSLQLYSLTIGSRYYEKILSDLSLFGGVNLNKIFNIEYSDIIRDTNMKYPIEMQSTKIKYGFGIESGLEVKMKFISLELLYYFSPNIDASINAQIRDVNNNILFNGGNTQNISNNGIRVGVYCSPF